MMRPYLKQRGLWDITVGHPKAPIKFVNTTQLEETPPPEYYDNETRVRELSSLTPQFLEWRKVAIAATFTVLSFVDFQIQMLYFHLDEDPERLWKTLERQYSNTGFTRYAELCTQLVNCKLTSKNAVEKYCRDFITI